MEAIPPPEVVLTSTRHVSCEGLGGALGHPRVYLQMGASGFADCGYCDRRFVLEGGPGDARAQPGETPADR